MGSFYLWPRNGLGCNWPDSLSVSMFLWLCVKDSDSVFKRAVRISVYDWVLAWTAGAYRKPKLLGSVRCAQSVYLRPATMGSLEINPAPGTAAWQQEIRWDADAIGKWSNYKVKRSNCTGKATATRSLAHVLTLRYPISLRWAFRRHRLMNDFAELRKSLRCSSFFEAAERSWSNLKE